MAIIASDYQLLEDVYQVTKGTPKTRERLEDALEALYVAVLSFQISVVVYIQSTTEKLKAGFITVAESLPQSLLDNIKQAEEDVRKQQSTSDSELGVLTYQKVSGIDDSFRIFLKQSEEDLARIGTQVGHILSAVELGKRREILKWLSPIQYESSHTKPERTPESGTND
jgi:hypothetical protein